MRARSFARARASYSTKDSRISQSTWKDEEIFSLVIVIWHAHACNDLLSVSIVNRILIMTNAVKRKYDANTKYAVNERRRSSDEMKWMCRIHTITYHRQQRREREFNCSELIIVSRWKVFVRFLFRRQWKVFAFSILSVIRFVETKSKVKTIERFAPFDAKLFSFNSFDWKNIFVFHQPRFTFRFSISSANKFSFCLWRIFRLCVCVGFKSKSICLLTTTTADTSDKYLISMRTFSPVRHLCVQFACYFAQHEPWPTRERNSSDRTIKSVFHENHTAVSLRSSQSTAFNTLQNTF